MSRVTVDAEKWAALVRAVEAHKAVTSRLNDHRREAGGRDPSDMIDALNVAVAAVATRARALVDAGFEEIKCDEDPAPTVTDCHITGAHTWDQHGTRCVRCDASR